MITLLPSAARVASGTLDVTGILNTGDRGLVGIGLYLGVTAAATAAGDTLNVYVQHSLDGGTNYDDFISFTQVLGNGGVKNFIAMWQHLISPATALRPKADGALAASVLQGGPIGDVTRVKWTVASASAPSFTFSLTGVVYKS